MIGAGSAVFVVRGDVRFLIAFPVWLLRKLMRYLRGGPAVAEVFLVIFLFNGTAMFVYLMSGAIPFLPHAIVFMTGMNVAVAGLKSGEILGEEEKAPEGEIDRVVTDTRNGLAVLDPLSAVCSLLVVLLELPCFWFTMALSAAPGFVGEMRPRIMAYVSVILPLLAVSALAEAYAVTRPFAEHPEGEA
jgi:hypothetical protein